MSLLHNQYNPKNLSTMGFWSFLRDMFVMNWLFGHSKNESFKGHHHSDKHRYNDYSHDHNDDYHNGGYGGMATMTMPSRTSMMTWMQGCLMMISEM